MKIIGGDFKGRAIKMPPGIRPTSDKVREALFEILKDRIEGVNFLDLFCGSGAIGIEALSRGAGAASFVDNNPRVISVLKKNLSLLDLSDPSMINIYKKGAVEALADIQRVGSLFDIVFIDPPYGKDMAKNNLIAISRCDILARNAMIVAEIYKKEILPESIGSLTKIRTSRYGDTMLEFFAK